MANLFKGKNTATCRTNTVKLACAYSKKLCTYKSVTVHIIVNVHLIERAYTLLAEEPTSCASRLESKFA